MKRETVKLLFTSILILLVMTACSGGESEAESTGTKHSSVVKNAKGEILAPEKRLWKNDLLGEEIALHSDIADSLFNPMNIKRFGNRLVISDIGDMRLKRFDLEGRYLDSFGSKGKGPGEFQRINDFVFNEKGTIYVIDGRKMRLMAFDSKNTSFITSYDTEPNPYRMAMLDEQLIIETLTAEKLFYKADFKGQTAGWFGEVMENQQQNKSSVLGELEATVSDSGFIFAPTYASYLYYFDIRGKNTRVIRGPDRIPFQETIHEQRGNMKITRPPRPDVLTKGLDISAERFYVTLINVKEESDLPETFLDLYDLESGRYLYSVELPEQTRDVLITKNSLYLVHSERAKVQAFRFKQRD